ncbi:MAG: hypothetical protein JNM63_15050, partial [Spirochaetia bacterium]|nr:hypothetical protein [Spirochaetia bacterium]
DNNAKWRQGFYSAGGLRYIDFMDIHVYLWHRRSEYGLSADASAEEAAGLFYKRLTMLDNDIRNAGGRSIPIIVSEEGVPTDATRSEKAQADYVRAIYQGGVGLPYLLGIYWYTLPQQKLDSRGKPAAKWGLLTEANEKKSGFYAFKEMANSIQPPKEFIEKAE